MDQNDVKRVIIKKATAQENLPKIELLMCELKLDVELTKMQLERGLLTQEKFEKKIKIWDDTYEELAKLSGFDSFDDMKYYGENFINNEGDQSK